MLLLPLYLTREAKSGTTHRKDCSSLWWGSSFSKALVFSFQVLLWHVLMFSCVATWTWYLNLSSSWKILTCPTHKGLEIISASRNPKLFRKESCLEGPGARMSQKGLRQHSLWVLCLSHRPALEKKWPLWKGSNSKSLPVPGGNDYFLFISAEGAPWQINQNPKIISMRHHRHTSPALANCSGSWASRHGKWPGSQCQPHLLRTLPPCATATGPLDLQTLNQ